MSTDSNSRQSSLSPQEHRKLILTMLVRIAMWPVFLGLLVLWPAGTWKYWEFYAYMGTMMLPMLWGMFYFLRRDPEFLVRRMQSREKEKEQKSFQAISFVIFIVGFVLPGLDQRFGWSEVPLWAVLSADALILLGYLVVYRVFRQNSYAARTVVVEEAQELIKDGLYARVRHPMYVGVILMFVPAALALGSLWALIPMGLLPLTLVFRILNEEKVLKEGLEGYEAYCEKVRWRLIPGIW